MESTPSALLSRHWQRKVVALFTAIVLWLFVNHSITATQVVPNIPVRIVNLPADKTIEGLLPNGLLDKRITLTLSGTKDVVQELEPADLELVFDASTADGDNWVIIVNKKNLVSLNPSINLAHHITQISHSDFVIHLSRLYTASIPIELLPPKGEPPEGYLFLDMWPEQFYQTVTGPEEKVRRLEKEGLSLQIDLSDVTAEELDRLSTSSVAGKENNEVTYFVPLRSKSIRVALGEELEEELNDPEAASWQLNFLRVQWLPLELELPVRVFYPLKYLTTINQMTHPMQVAPPLREELGQALYSSQLYVWGVSSLFLTAVKHNMEISVVAAPPEQKPQLHWSVDVVDPRELENTYVALLLASTPAQGKSTIYRRREALLRKRFQGYLQRLVLYSRQEQKLQMDWSVAPAAIVLQP